MFPLYFAIYVGIGIAFTEVRRFFIKRDSIWSVMALIDYADGFMADDAEEIALRNNRWIWAVWPPFVIAELMFGTMILIMVGGIAALDFFLGGGKKKQEASSDAYGKPRKYEI